MTAVSTISDSRSVSNEDHSIQDTSSDLDVDIILDVEIIIPSDFQKDSKGKGANHCSQNNSWAQLSNGNISARKKEICATEEISNASVPSLDTEQMLHEEKYCKRKELFSSIINNTLTDLSISSGIFYTLGISAMGFIIPSPLALFPFHDLTQTPGHWYEILIQGVFGLTWSWMQYCLNVAEWLNISRIRTPSNVAFMCFFGNMAQGIVYILTHYIWINIYKYSYPIPGFYKISTLAFLLLWDAVTWFCFPKQWRQNNGFKQRMKYVIFTVALFIIYNLTNGLIVEQLQANQNQYQAIIALLLPALREVFFWICSKFMEKTSNGDANGAKTTMKIAFSLQYALVLCVSFGTFATDVTSWVLVAIDYLCNIVLCLQIVRMKKENLGTIRNEDELIQDLTLNELVEFHAPVSYMITYLLIHIGPNGCLFWSNHLSCNDKKKMIEVVTNILFFSSIDFASTLLIAIILWVSCKINLWKSFFVMQKENYLEFAVMLGFTMFTVNKIYVIIYIFIYNSIHNKKYFSSQSYFRIGITF